MVGSGNLSSLSTSIVWQIPLTSMVYFYKIFEKKLNFVKFWNFEIFDNFDLFCNLIGRLEMKSRLWLDNVETSNRQETKIDTSPNIPHARCTHSKVELRKCCLGQSAKSKIPYHLIKLYIKERFWGRLPIRKDIIWSHIIIYNYCLHMRWTSKVVNSQEKQTLEG